MNANSFRNYVSASRLTFISPKKPLTADYADERRLKKTKNPRQSAVYLAFLLFFLLVLLILG